MHADDVLTVPDIRSGIEAAIECRRIVMQHAIRQACFMAFLGLLLVAIGYYVQGHVSPLAFLLPAFLMAVVTIGPVRQSRKLALLAAELAAAELRVMSGITVRAGEVHGLELGAA